MSVRTVKKTGFVNVFLSSKPSLISAPNGDDVITSCDHGSCPTIIFSERVLTLEVENDGFESTVQASYRGYESDETGFPVGGVQA